MLSAKELATILAALRFLQANFNDLEEMREEMPLHFEKVSPLNHQEIDELYEKLNAGNHCPITSLHQIIVKTSDSETDRLSDGKRGQITEQMANTFLDFCNWAFEAVVDIDAATQPQMKYLLVEIAERNGEKEYTARCLAQCPSEQNPNLVADAIAVNWYEDCLDDESPFDHDSFWFEGGAIAVEVAGVKEVSAQHYDVLSLYLSDLTPVDTDITRAIAYKSAALSYQGESKNG